MLSLFDNDSFQRDTLYWEHEGNRAVRKGKWKLVNKYPGDWELYDIAADRTETTDMSGKYPEIVYELSMQWQEWANRCNVKSWQELVEDRKKRLREAK